MRKTMFLLAMIGMTSLLWAADPSVGTWKLNVGKCKFSANEPAGKEETMVVKQEGNQLIVTQKGVRVDGSAISNKYSHSVKGGIVKGEDLATPNKGITYVITVIAPGDRYFAIVSNNEQMQLHHVLVSKDGKTTTLTSSGMDEKGKSVDATLVFEKQ
jgi:hypothetical protein